MKVTIKKERYITMRKPNTNKETTPETPKNPETKATPTTEKKEEREVKTMKENTKKNPNTNETTNKENPFQKYIDMVNKLMSECGLKYEYKADQNRHFYYNPDLMKSVQRQFLFTYSKNGVRIATREEYNTLYEGKICKYNLPLAISTDYSNLYKVVTHLRKGYKDTMKALEKEREKASKKEVENA